MDLLILHGADTYSSRKRLVVLREGFKKKYDTAGSNVSSFVAPFEIAKVRASAAQVGMFAKKRLVVLYDFYSTALVADREQFNAWLDAEAFPDTVMIAWESKDLGKPAAPKKTAPKKPSKSKAKKPAIAPTKISWPAHAKVEVFEPLAAAQLLAWIRNEVKRLGGSIEPSAVMQLATNVGPDLWAMSGVVAQIVASAGGKPITQVLVGEWSKAPLDDNIFHFTDALSARNAAAALGLFQSQLQLGVHPLVLHAMLTRQLRMLLVVEDCLNRKLAPGSIAAETDLHPYVAQKAIAAVRQFPAGTIRQLFLDLAQLDVDMKTGKVDPELGLVHFIAKVCVK
ncbi:MAG: DNA polymerase III subunit delta [bacterium]|nr:DNA polymerase III subunit delta [bacterium]